MKWTKDPRIAMRRLAEVFGWEVESVGRAWFFLGLDHAEGLTFTSVAALCFMTRIAMAPTVWGGGALTGLEVRELIRFRPVHLNSRGRSSLDLPRMASTDESTMYAAYFNPTIE